MSLCLCGCKQIVVTGGYAGADEPERCRHRARRSQQKKAGEKRQELLRNERQAVVAAANLTGLDFADLLEAAGHQQRLAEALVAEALERAASCDENAVPELVAAATAELIARMGVLELEAAALRASNAQLKRDVADLENRAAVADADAVKAGAQLRRQRAVTADSA